MYLRHGLRITACLVRVILSLFYLVSPDNLRSRFRAHDDLRTKASDRKAGGVGLERRVRH